MQEWKSITPRVAKIRNKYRETLPVCCLERYQLATEFYQGHPELVGILKRARAFAYYAENMPAYIDEDEVIVGAQGACFRANAIYPEIFFSNPMLYNEMKNNTFRDRVKDNYTISDETIAYIAETGEYWLTQAFGARIDEYIPDTYREHVAGNGVISFPARGNNSRPFGHFIAGFDKVIRTGWGALKAQADEKLAQMDGHVFGNDMERFQFYRAVSIVCAAMTRFTQRYAEEARRQASACSAAERKAELLKMAEVLDWVAVHPARTFQEALQSMFLYNTALAIDGNLHGLSFGRVDQYLGRFYEADIAAGRLTPERAQELLDLFYLKVAQCSKVEPNSPFAGLGFTTGEIMTLGGVDQDGNDATNAVTYMMLQSAGRLVLHDPPQALRIHPGTPADLWELAIETTKRAGGVPTFENDEVIIPALMRHGLSEDSARNYGIVGCVEPGGCGDEWTCAGGNGNDNFFNLPACVLLAMNNGYNPMPNPDGSPVQQTGLPTGYLYEMKTFDEVLDAVWKQMEYFINWMMTMFNACEYVARSEMPLPLVSVAIEGCMESGKDVMYGGAKYNSMGMAGIGIGNIVDSLAVIKYLVYDTGKVSGKVLLDAVLNNWEGQEELRQYILHECPHYGNDVPWVDELATLFSEKFQQLCINTSGPRCRLRPGLWPVTMNVLFGMFTAATFDGRLSGTPLADGISPVQGLDKNGPTALLKSASYIDQKKLGNGTLLNMRFHPTAVSGEAGVQKLRSLMSTYFALGGMQLQINVTDTETLRAAQEKPEAYKDLVVRVAGFSVYFVELFKGSQDDIISRTELGL